MLHIHCVCMCVCAHAYAIMAEYFYVIKIDHLSLISTRTSCVSDKIIT